MRVGLRQRRGDPHRRGGEHHRPGDETAAAEYDVRPAPLEDPAAREGCAPRADERPRKLRRRLPRKAADLERIELVAGLRDESRFDPIRRPGERHVNAALRQRLRHRERRQHVSGRSAGGDQAPKLRLRGHAARC